MKSRFSILTVSSWAMSSLLVAMVQLLPSPVAASSSNVLTLLPLTRDGKPSETLTQGAAERLMRMGEDPEPPRGVLSPSDQTCATTSCLGVLAQRLQAARVIGGNVTASAQRRFAVKLFLYDSSARRLVNQDAACEDCSERQLGAMVDSLAAKLVAVGTASVRPAPRPTSPAHEPVAAASPSSERASGEFVELLKGQGATLNAVRASIEKTRDNQDKIRDAADKTRVSTEKLRDNLERSVKDSTDKIKETADRTQASLDRLRDSVEKASDSTRVQAGKLAAGLEKASASAESARQESTQTREAALQASMIAGKTLQSVEQLNGISTDLRTALTTVEPLRAAAEQTQQTAQINAQKSAELLQQVEAQRVASLEILSRAEQTLRLMKEQDARRGISRKRKIGAGILGSLSVAFLGAAVTLSALDATPIGPCMISGDGVRSCVTYFSPWYVSIGYTLSALFGAGTVAVLAVPARSGN